MSYRWKQAKYRFSVWLYKQIYNRDPYLAFNFQCPCGLEALFHVPKPGTVIQYTCEVCKAKHRMIWLTTHWQTSSIFNEEKVEFKPLNLPGHPRVEEAP
jgi:hypothetical protein